jgi:hypothetical protein
VPLLGDYLGQLLSEITIARMHADLEAMRVAELYASHPLLRTMPVPRFRLPDVELDVPVVIKQMDPPRTGESPRGGVDLAKLRKLFDTILASQLRKGKIRISDEQRIDLRSSLDEAITTLEQPTEIAVNTNRIADRLTDAASRALRATLEPEDTTGVKRIDKLESELKNMARLAFLKARTPPPRLEVLVTTQEIREAGPDEIITRLRLKITEESVEWTMVESEGELQDRLVPE